MHVQVCCPGLIDTEFHTLAGRDLSGSPFPVLRPDEVADAALAGLRLGETVCIPGLPNPSMFDASASPAGAVHDSGELTARRPLRAHARN